MSEGTSESLPSVHNSDEDDAEVGPEVFNLLDDSTAPQTQLTSLQPPLAIATNLIQRRPSGSDNEGNPRSHLPGSSQSSDEGLDKGQTLDVDLEAQEDARRKAARTRCFVCCSPCCPEWMARTNFGKWYDWTAYYIPILEWLPKYHCTPFLYVVNLGNYVARDIFAGLTLASISIPMSLSYAAYISFQILT